MAEAKKRSTIRSNPPEVASRRDSAPEAFPDASGATNAMYSPDDITWKITRTGRHPGLVRVQPMSNGTVQLPLATAKWVSESDVDGARATFLNQLCGEQDVLE